MRHRPLWTRLFLMFVMLNVCNVYAGGLQAGMVHRLNRQVAEHNRLTLERLGFKAPYTLSEIEARKVKARAQILSSRADLIQRQREGQALKERQLPGVWSAQARSNRLALSQLTEEMGELIARIQAPEPGDDVLQLGRTLWFHRKNLDGFSRRLGAQGELPAAVIERIAQVSQTLDALGVVGADVTVESTLRAAAAAEAVLRKLHAADEKAHRVAKGGLAPNPLFPGRDPLTGHALSIPPNSGLKPVLTEPLERPRTTAAELLELYADVQGAQATQKQTPPTSPVAADLAATPDAPQSQAIIELAARLGNDPLAIYNYVATEVDYLLYNGSLYGAQGALDVSAGNDMDQASLLIALLRASGYPARYSTATVALTPAQVRGMTGIQDVATAGSALVTNGIPAVTVYDASGVREVQLQHTWVMAYVPYSNYRGLKGSGGGGESQWVSLDPSLKSYVLEQQVDLDPAITYDIDSYISESEATSPVEYFDAQVRAWIATTDTRCETLDQIRVKRVNTAKPVELLPNAVPFTLVGARVLTPSLSDSVRHSVNVQLTDDWGFTVLNSTIKSVDAYGKTLAVTFPSGSGIYSSMSGNVKPTISLGGTIIAQSSSVAVGAEMPAYVQLRGPGTPYAYRSHDLVAGGSFAINVWKGPVPERLVAEARGAVSDLKASGAAQNRVDLAVAQLAGLSYFNHLYDDDKALFALHGHLHFTDYEAATGTSLSTIYYFGFPYGAERAGFNIDAESTFAAFPMEGKLNSSTVADIAFVSGLNGSFYEHAMWGEAIGSSALSTTNILQKARSMGQTVHFLESIDEYNAIRGQLSHGSSVLNAVQAALNRGDEVIISDRGISQGSKTVSGWIEFDANTGSGRYMISSLNNGGETTEIFALLSELASLLGYGEPINSRANMSSGSLSDQKPEQFFRSSGRLYVLIYNYNSDMDVDGDLGPGWTWTFGNQLFVNPTTGDITYLQEEGLELPFKRNTDGSFVSPPSISSTLTAQAGGWALTDPSGRVRTFDADGRLTADTDAKGNQILVVQSQGKIDKLTDATGRLLVDATTDADGHLTQLVDMLGRTTTFTYTGGRLTELVDPNGERWTYVYNGAGELIGKLQADGATIEYGFDADGRLARHTTPSGDEGFFGYDWDNLKSAWQDPAGSEQLYTFDEQGQLVEHVDEVGNLNKLEWDDGHLVRFEDGRGEVTTRSYDDAGNMTEEVRPDGTSTAYTFDEQNRITSKIEADGSTSSWDYNDNNNTVTVDRGQGDQVLTFDPQGNLINSVDTEGQSNTFVYDANGNMVSSTDAENNTTVLTNDAAGNTIAISHPNGETLSLDYDDRGQLVGTTLPSGDTLTMSYTPYGDLETAASPGGLVNHYTYNQRWLTGTTDAYGHATSYLHDPMGRVRQMVDPNGQVLENRLDAAGRVIAMTDGYGQSTELNFCADIAQAPCDLIDPQGNLIQRQFDKNGRMVSETTSLGTSTWEYDKRDRVVSFTDALGNTNALSWNAMGSLTQVVDAIGGNTTYTYNASNQVTSVTDPEGATTQMLRNTMGQLTQVIDALGRVTEYTYGADRKLTSMTNPLGQTTTYQHDDLGFTTAEIFDDGSSHAYSWDSSGRKLRSTSGDADIEYKYQDTLGRLTQVINHTLGLTLEVEYDARTGNRSKLTRPDGAQTYTWDAHGKLASTTLPNSKSIRFVYDDFGRLEQKILPNGNVEHSTWDEWNRLTAVITYDSQGVAVAGAAYTYDALHRKISSTDVHRGQTTYTYDALSRLTQEASPSDTTVYTYDGVGNRLTEKVNGQLTTTFTYDNSHRLLSKVDRGVTTTYTWDAAGRLTGKAGGENATYTYDVAGRMTSVLDGGQQWRYGYDAEGRRAWRETPTETANILYDYEDAVLEVDDAGDMLRGFGHGKGIDDPLALFDYADTGKSYYYHADGMGSILALSDPQGKLAAAYSYSAFGELTTQQADVYNDHTFMGRRADLGTGLYDFRARVLDPSVGRFQQSDPLSIADYERTRTGLSAEMSPSGGQAVLARMLMPQSQNPYGFVSNNPLNMIDPTGEDGVPLGIVDYLQGLILGLIVMCIANIALAVTVPWLGTLAAVISWISVLISVIILVKSLVDSTGRAAFVFNLLAGIATIGLSIWGIFAVPAVGTVLFIIWMHFALIMLIIGLIFFP